MATRISQRLVPLVFIVFLALDTAAISATVKIGALFDLSGPKRSYGNAMLQGASAAIRYYNQRLRPLGMELELSVKDTGAQQGRLLLGAMDLDKKYGVLALIGPTDTSLVKSAMGYSEAHNIPLILTSGDVALNPTPWYKIKWTYGVSPSIGQMAKAFFREIKKMGIKGIGLLVEDGAGFNKEVPWIRAYGTEYQVKILGIDGFSPEDVDVVTQLRHLRDLGSELILYRGGEAFLPRLLASLKDTPVKVAFPMDTPIKAVAKYHGTTPSGAIFVQSPLLFQEEAIETPQRISIIRFKNAIEATTIRSRPEIIAAAKAWDAIGLLATTLLNGAPPSRNGILKVLAGRRSRRIEIYVKYHGLMADYSPNRRDHCGIDTHDLKLLPWE